MRDEQSRTFLGSMTALSIDEVSVAVGLEYAKYYSRPNEVTMPLDPQQYCGGIDISIPSKYKPLYIAAKDGPVIRGMAAGHSTTDHLFRLSWIHIFEEQVPMGTYSVLLSAIGSRARANGAKHIWTLSRNQSEFNLYEFLDFKKSQNHRNEGWCYMIKVI